MERDDGIRVHAAVLAAGCDGSAEYESDLCGVGGVKGEFQSGLLPPPSAPSIEEGETIICSKCIF